jgi:hypothetical protein
LQSTLSVKRRKSERPDFAGRAESPYCISA